ncbi:hypothetical protein SAPIO_CDS4150 [Scedosporium apiospermum]|uniref:Uncharacterized protein n=1 Tax=Pseudallescheria apiosperma TaxID=563466 RepID=A0A084G9D9_PSEDA|nr:uncharacterized protein SAPIO_CDS4150 [Scedosporium apiospermum]KEZ43951.1 hypothetical protein SAPIO_CDS4150 [Scedosporium apiospermum]
MESPDSAIGPLGTSEKTHGVTEPSALTGNAETLYGDQHKIISQWHQQLDQLRHSDGAQAEALVSQIAEILETHAWKQDSLILAFKNITDELRDKLSSNFQSEFEDNFPNVEDGISDAVKRLMTGSPGDGDTLGHVVETGQWARIHLAPDGPLRPSDPTGKRPLSNSQPSSPVAGDVKRARTRQPEEQGHDGDEQTEGDTVMAGDTIITVLHPEDTRETEAESEGETGHQLDL